jgi:uncharacterized protein YqgV (UPF0045/DUF77 family)
MKEEESDDSHEKKVKKVKTPMKITVDISLYPLDSDYVHTIKSFILRLRTFPGLEIVTNQLSTQLRGEFDPVTTAINTCVHESMSGDQKVVFVVRYLNADLEIGKLPDIE